VAATNHERVGKALDLLKEGLYPFVERELQAQYGKSPQPGRNGEVLWSST
jgi:hypothetical protein